jgi:hypothetical protein
LIVEISPEKSVGRLDKSYIRGGVTASAAATGTPKKSLLNGSSRDTLAMHRIR